MVLFKDDLFEVLAEKTVYYDEEDVHDRDRSDGGSAENSQSTQWWKGTSRLTNNIGLIVALRYKGNEQAFVVATTHLFWHPA
jgi:RNA exonuclease NGL2